MFRKKKSFLLGIVLAFGVLVSLSSFEVVEASTQNEISYEPDHSLYKEVPSNEITFTDENGVVLDSDTFKVYEKLSFSRAQIVSKSYSVIQNNSHGFFTSSIYVSFASPPGYLTSWAGTLYFVRGGAVETWGGTYYQALYSGTVYSKIR